MANEEKTKVLAAQTPLASADGVDAIAVRKGNGIELLNIGKLNANSVGGRTTAHLGEITPLGTRVQGPAWVRIGQVDDEMSHGVAFILMATKRYTNSITNSFTIAINAAFGSASAKVLNASFGSSDTTQCWLPKLRLVFSGLETPPVYIEAYATNSQSDLWVFSAFGKVRIYNPSEWVVNPSVDGMTAKEMTLSYEGF